MKPYSWGNFLSAVFLTYVVIGVRGFRFNFLNSPGQGGNSLVPSGSTDNQNEDICPFLMCGLNAVKTVNPRDFSDCYCSCPHNSQGDPIFECKKKEFGSVPSLNRFITRGNGPKQEWPWMATIGYFETYGWVHKCGASLITHRHILTAAHCTLDIEPTKWYVLIGVNNISIDSTEDWTERRIWKVYRHPSFEQIPGSAYYDVAVLVLDRAVEFTDSLWPVRLPEAPLTNENPYAGSSVSIMGWGDGSRKVLDSVEIQIYSQSFCQDKYDQLRFGAMRAKIAEMLPKNFSRGIFCAGNPVTADGACYGDSGGPLVKFFDQGYETSHFQQIGLIQGGLACGDKNVPGIFVSLTDETVLDFVLEKSGMKKSNYWGPWSAWSKCSVSCGEGVQTRRRTCGSSGDEGDVVQCEGPTEEWRKCRWSDCGEEIFSLSYIAVTLSNQLYSGCDCKIFIQLTNTMTGERCITKRLNKPGNDWAQGTTDTWSSDFLGACHLFTTTSQNENIEIDFLLSGRDHIQVDAVTAGFKSRTSTKELKFHQFCLGWSGDDLRRTGYEAEKPSLLYAKLEKGVPRYEVSLNPMSWYESSKFCASMGLRQVEIHSRCEEIRVQEHLKVHDLLGEKNFWLGSSFNKILGIFSWNDSQMEYSNWLGNRWPTDTQNRCVAILGQSRQWRNMNCSDRKNFAFCEKK